MLVFPRTPLLLSRYIHSITVIHLTLRRTQVTTAVFCQTPTTRPLSVYTYSKVKPVTDSKYSDHYVPAEHSSELKPEILQVSGSVRRFRDRTLIMVLLWRLQCILWYTWSTLNSQNIYRQNSAGDFTVKVPVYLVIKLVSSLLLSPGIISLSFNILVKTIQNQFVLQLKYILLTLFAVSLKWHYQDKFLTICTLTIIIH